MSNLLVLANLPASSYAGGDVTTPKRPDIDEAPIWANAIRARRAYLRKSQEVVAADSGDVLYQTEISRIERGQTHPVNDLPLPRFFAFLKAYQWTIEDFTQATTLEVPYISQEQAEAIEAAKDLEVHSKYLQFPVYTGASAGVSDPDAIDGEVAFISTDKLRAKGADPRYVNVYRVNGDCMVSSEAQRLQKNIAHGDFIAVDTRRRPKPGDTVVAWWPQEQKLVVKRFRVEEEGIVLFPLSAGHPTVVLKHEEDINVIGVVIWREG